MFSRFLRLLFFSLIVTGGMMFPVMSQADSTVSLQSVNYPTHYVRHRGFLGFINPIISELDRKDASFVMVPGLATPNYVSFRSVNYPSRFLRHQFFQIKLHPSDGSNLFKLDATFKKVAGLYGNGGFSFESVNYPGHYIRHSLFALYIHRNDGSELFRKDATFKVVPAFVTPPKPVVDDDKDGVSNGADNCPKVFNPKQKDADKDKIGNACDNCPNVFNPKQKDANKDKIGNACTKPQRKTKNIVRNPSFEKPKIGSKRKTFKQILGGWTAKSGDIEILRGVGTPMHKKQFVELDAHNSSTIYQDLKTKPGKTYRLRFHYSACPGSSAADNKFKVSWGGKIITTINAGAGGNNTVWNRHVSTVVAKSDKTRLEFKDLGQSNGVGSCIDMVTVAPK